MFRRAVCRRSIVIDREFVDSGTLQRHKLSALFTDMPDDDFKKLCASIEANGFIEPIIRIYEGQILDGWHRYRAAKELNLIRKLKFQEWKERDEGDPAAFVLARNIERRHLTPGQRGVIVVEMHKWLEHGDVGSQRDDPLNDGSQPKTTAELAKEVGVGTATIERAKEVSRAGQSDKVIAGEKSVGEVLKEQEAERDNERETAIVVVKPRFQSAVETWRASQVERLRKFEGLPVGRTPLLESEYLKTYFELAEPRIPQNTKPTAAHYGDAIACLLDRPAAFAKQLEGRHYRRIIKEWDASVLLQLVERFQSGHILGYPALETDSDANAGRIRQAIRDHYGFKGRITSQPFEVLFEITEDAHAVLVQLNPKEWMRKGQEISWAVSVLPEPIDTPSEVSHYDDSDRTTSREIPKEQPEETVKDLPAPEVYTEEPERQKIERETRKLRESIQTFLIGQGLTYRIGLAGVLGKLAEDYKLREDFYTGEYQGVPPDDLQAEYNTLSAVFVDLQNPDSRIRRELVSLTAEPEADTRDTLWQAFNKQRPKWKAKYEASGYGENALIQESTEADLFDALRLHRKSDQTGEPTAEEIKDVTALMKSQSYVFARNVWDIVRERRSLSETDPSETPESVELMDIVATYSDADGNLYQREFTDTFAMEGKTLRRPT